jgi:GNAT superfamily N-acetyltransferase
MATTTRHWAAFAADSVIGCVSVMQLRGYALRGLAVAAQHRRRGIGAKLLQTVHAEVDEPMWCNARIEAVPFYLSMGWLAVGPTFEMRKGGLHQRMIWRHTSEVAI